MSYAVLRELADAAVGIDKVLTNAELVAMDIEIIQVDVTTTATAGNRSIDVEIRDDADVVLASITLTDVAASQTNVLFNIYPGSGDGELPPFALRAEFDLHFVDSAAIDVLDTIAVRAFMRGAPVSASLAG